MDILSVEEYLNNNYTGDDEKGYLVIDRIIPNLIDILNEGEWSKVKLILGLTILESGEASYTIQTLIYPCEGSLKGLKYDVDVSPLQWIYQDGGNNQFGYYTLANEESNILIMTVEKGIKLINSLINDY